MRILIAALLCAGGAALVSTPASALPASALALGPAGLSASDPFVPVKSKGKGKAARASKAKGGKCAPGAICPLVGSGDY